MKILATVQIAELSKEYNLLTQYLSDLILNYQDQPKPLWYADEVEYVTQLRQSVLKEQDNIRRSIFKIQIG